MNRLKNRYAFALITSCGLAMPVLAQVAETEPNETKANADTVGVINLPAVNGPALTGTTTGTSTTVPGAASADTFRVRTAAMAPGIYRNRLIITSTIAGHGGTLRGLNQSSVGIIGTTDNTAQTASTATTPPRFNQWYTFGPQAELYYRVTGTATTTAPYVVNYEVAPVSTIPVAGTITAGTVQIRDTGTNDIDFWVYDSNLNPIAAFGNDEPEAGGVTRSMTPGTYYLAFSRFNGMNNLASAAPETFAGTVLDFPGAFVSSSNTAGTVIPTFTSTAGTVTAPTTTFVANTNAFDVPMYQFTVTAASNPVVNSVVATPNAGPIGTTCLVVANVSPGTSPTAPITSVSLDATQVDGGTVTLNDSGIAPDVTAGDNNWSGSVTVGAAITDGTKILTATATDQLARTGTGTGSFLFDAGGTLATARVLDGTGSLTAISGELGANDVDMYKIHICSPTTFSASTVGGAGFDTQLFLFRPDGVGIASNDDTANAQSTITNLFTASLPEGDYYLAVTQYDKDPVDLAGDAMWLDTPFNSERAPDGPGASNGIWNWDTIAGTGGAYTITLTGTSLEPCPVTATRVFGIPVTSQGNALMKRRADGSVLLYNLGTTGNDGIEFMYGQTQFGTPGFLSNPLTMQQGATVTDTVFGEVGGSGNQVHYVLQATLTGTNMIGGVTFNSSSPGTFSAQARLGGDVVAQNFNVPSTSGLQVQAAAKCGKGKKKNKGVADCNQPGGGHGFAIAWVNFDDAVAVSLGGMPPVVADEIRMDANGSADFGWVQRETILLSGVPSVEVQSAGFRKFNQALSGLGDTLIQGIGETAQVQGIGSSGLDGIRIEFNRLIDSFEVAGNYAAANAPTVPINAFVRAVAYGIANEVPDQPIGEITFRKQALDRCEVTVNFQAVNSPTHRITLLANGTVVADFPGQTGVVTSASAWPISIGKLGGQTECFFPRWPNGTQFQINGTTYVGNELRVLAEGTGVVVDFKSSLDILAAGVPSLTLTGFTDSPVCSACDSIDFNNDTSLFDPQDIDAFLSVYSEGPCIPETATCNDIDFNNDGSLFDPCDIDSFLLVFSEGPCTPCGS